MSSNKCDAYNNPMLSLSIEDRVKALVHAICDDPDYTGYDTPIARQVVLTSVTPGRTEWEATVQPFMCNKSKNLHGGAACTLLDNLTSTALLTIAREGFLDGGHVSRTITMTYLRPVPVGTKVRMVCTAVSAGKRLAHCTGQIETMDGKLCVTMVHDKAVIPRPTNSKL
ncbi:hypothetical protein LTR70_003220 [Exophiala xenobiotica]|uniref:Thioesterase domain-containing protein n=1 Tax=Lithohypha guttulata TaxID=1690604 RepID=A0ABR0KHN2_9EURO|nr:hypothetical protein LTR24_002865 [Lithohypha guttulata]KAK5323732.1 hypothetical protein LTR70_003220 [Exophiala xenobiotica]